MSIGHPCPPKPFTWWFSRSQEGPWQEAGETRENAITQAVSEICGDEMPPEDGHGWCLVFYVQRMRRKHLDLSLEFNGDDWLTGIDEDLCDEWGPDEDGDHGCMTDVTMQDIADLQASVRSAIWHWQQRKALPLSPYWLDMDSASFERVVMPLPDDDGA